MDSQQVYSLPDPTFCDGIEEPGFVPLGDEDLCYIDDQTSKCLELLENNIDSTNRRHSLYGYLNTYTSTTIGSRLLREVITKPYCHLETISSRLDCIEFLVNRVDTLSIICTCIKRFGRGIDLDNLVMHMVNMLKVRSQTMSVAEKRLDILSVLESIAGQVDQIISVLVENDEPTLNLCRSVLTDPAFNDIRDEIQHYLDPESKLTKIKRMKIFRIKNGVDSLFDIARTTYFAALDDIETYVRELVKESDIPWRQSYSETRGYYLMVSTDKVDKNFKPGPNYVSVNKNRQAITCTTKELMQLDVRARVSYENSMKLANEILIDALSTVIKHAKSIERLMDIIGMLDLTSSFAKLVSSSNGTLVRPRFTATETIIEGGRHPVMEQILESSGLNFVENDTRLKTRSNNFMLVTGPNMGGKSIYLKQVAVIQVMAQIGCYVPATSAHIKLMNRIVARTGIDNDNCSNCSSFMWEMKGIATTMQTDRARPHESALYIIDEVGRGTSIDCGASYSFAIAEELCLRDESFTLFATHFDQLLALGQLYKNVTIYHFQFEVSTSADDGKMKLKTNHRLLPGESQKLHYGIKLAQICGIPEEIIGYACEGMSS